MKRPTEDIIIAREAANRILTSMVMQMYDSRVTKDCQAHMAEMRNDPVYVPFQLTVEHMIFMTEQKRGP